MIVFDSYVNLFQSPTLNRFRTRSADLDKHHHPDATGSFNDTISHSAYLFTSLIDRVLRKY